MAHGQPEKLLGQAVAREAVVRLSESGLAQAAVAVPAVAFLEREAVAAFR